MLSLCRPVDISKEGIVISKAQGIFENSPIFAAEKLQNLRAAATKFEIYHSRKAGAFIDECGLYLKLVSLYKTGIYVAHFTYTMYNIYTIYPSLVHCCCLGPH